MKEDDLLRQADEKGFVLLNKSVVDEDFRKTVNKLAEYDCLREHSKGTFKLTPSGRESLRLGFDVWLANENKPHEPTIAIDVKGDFNGGVNYSSSNNALKSPTTQNITNTKLKHPSKKSPIEIASWVIGI